VGIGGDRIVATALRRKGMDDLIGLTFGGYELKDRVGAGGVASIYKGFDEKLSRWVAIKVVPIQASGGATEETMLARFRLEAQAIAALRHRNILTIYGYGEEEGYAYIVMEYVPGGSLKDRIETSQPFTWEQALTVIIPVSEALAFAHNHNIIHRDIKPANILMPEDDWPLLADFGLAKMEHAARPNLTMPGQVLGTMAYAAPEQIQEGEIDARIDIYSLAIVLYELLSGKLPFEGETSFDFLMARLTEPPRPVIEANPDVPYQFIPILDKALAQDPGDRYQTMAEFSQDLIEARYKLRRGPQEATSVVDTDFINEAAVALKLTKSGEEIVKSNQSELIVGRAVKNSPPPDIDLGPHQGAKAGVSRRHARLIRDADSWYVEDLGSTNGTFLNGAKLTPHQKNTLETGDKVRFGQIELEFGLEN
jgi:serine/threonine protein kinase